MSLALEHAPIAYKAAGGYFWPGATREDVQQEALLGLVLAERDYRPELGHFGVFAKVVVHRRLTECVRREAYRRPRFSELSGEHPDQDDVVDLIDARFRLRRVLNTSFSELETVAVGRAFRGEPCPRPLDNALHRARRKVAA